jgi:hypothetical protein
MRTKTTKPNLNFTRQSSKQRMPICALLAITVLLLGYLLRSIGSFGKYEGLWIGYCDAAGLILAIASILRREKPAILSWFVLLLSLAPYILLFLIYTLNIKF